MKALTERNEWGNCAYGKEAHPAEKRMSGTPICWAHWNWVKLNEPAARHWARVAEEFLSNVDMYDVTKFLPACGLTEEQMGTMIDSARKVRDHSIEVLKGV